MDLDSGTLECEGVLIARTVPEETTNGDITVCSAWWAPALGGLIRIYPLDISARARAWHSYRLTLTKSEKDSRWRSFRLAAPPEFIEKVGRERFREILAKGAREATIAKLNTARDSMGVIRPIAMRGVMEHGEPDVTRHFGRKTFGTRPRLQFTDLDGDHNLGLNEWGCYEWLRKGNPPDELWDNLRLGYTDREQLLLVGNLRDYRTSWVVIAVIGYAAAQISLLPTVIPEQRTRIFARDGYCCVLCGNKETLTIDHIRPRSRGGDNSDENLRTLCLQHNLTKSDRLDAEWMAV